jgi:hypothetical protein
LRAFRSTSADARNNSMVLGLLVALLCAATRVRSDRGAPSIQVTGAGHAIMALRRTRFCCRTR